MEKGMSRRELAEMLNELDRAFTNDCAAAPGSSTCLAHSGIKTTLKYLLTENLRQWDVIGSIDKRLWGIVLGVAATFAVVLLQLLTRAIP